MTPEEFYYMDNVQKAFIFEMRVSSLGWLLDCFRSKKIRKTTIVNLIQETQLTEILDYLLEQERYEECAIVRDILNEIYDDTRKTKV